MDKNPIRILNRWGIFIIIFGIIFLSGFGNAETGSNIALNGYAVVSSNAGAAYIGNKSIDDDYNTRWVTDWNELNNQYIFINWTTSHVISAITIHQDLLTGYYTYFANVTIDFSDGSSITHEFENKGGGQSIYFEPKTISWLNMSIDDSYGTEHYYSIQEFEIYNINLTETIYTSDYHCTSWICDDGGTIYIDSEKYRGYVDSAGRLKLFTPSLQIHDGGDDDSLWTADPADDAMTTTFNLTKIKEGNSSLQLKVNTSKSVSNYSTWYDQTSHDLTDYQNGYLNFWLYISDASTLQSGNSIFLSLGSDRYSNRMYWYITRNQIQNGWNYITKDIDAGTTQGTPVWTAIDRLLISFTHNMSNLQNTTYLLDDIRVSHDNNTYAFFTGESFDIFIDSVDQDNFSISSGFMESRGDAKVEINLSFNVSRQIDDCGDTSNVELWIEDTNSYDGMNPTENSTEYHEGTTSMQLAWNTSHVVGNLSQWIYQTSLGDLSEYQHGYLTIWFYAKDTSVLGNGDGKYMFLALGSDVWNNRVYKHFPVSEISNGWNLVVLDFDTDTTQGTPDWTAIDVINMIICQNESNLQNTSVLIDDVKLINDNNTISIDWGISNNSEYIELNYTIYYDTAINVSREGIEIDLPILEDYTFLDRQDYAEEQFFRTFYSDAYTPKRFLIDLPNSIFSMVLHGDDTFEGMCLTDKLRLYTWLDSLRIDSFEENAESLAPYHMPYIQGENSTASIRFKITQGTLPKIQKSRYWNAYDSVLVFTEHPDFGELNDGSNLYKRLLAMFYGTSNLSSPDFGTKGVVSHNLGFTRTVWAINDSGSDSDVYGSLDNTDHNDTIKRMFDAGIEIGSHLVCSNHAMDRTQVERGLGLFNMYNSVTWIDHGPDNCTANPDYHGITGCGKDPSSNYFILDKLEAHGWKWVWASGQDDAPGGGVKHAGKNSMGMKYLIQPTTLYTHPQVWNKTSGWKMWLFSCSEQLTTTPYFISWTTNSAYLDTFRDEKGLHVSHCYYTINGTGAISGYKPNWYIENGVYKINVSFETGLVNLETRQNNREILVSDMNELGDWLLGWQNIRTVEMNDTHITVRNDNDNSVSGVTYFLTDQNISHAKIGNQYMIFGRDEYIVLPEFSSGESKTIEIEGGASWNTTIPHLTFVPSPVTIYKAEFGQSADQGNGVVTIQSWGSSDYILEINMPNASDDYGTNLGCSYGFLNATILNYDIDTCTYNISVAGGENKTIESYFIAFHANLTVSGNGNITEIYGNYTWLNITFADATTPSNITAYMSPVNNECNYKATNADYSLISYCGQSCDNCTIIITTSGENKTINIVVSISDDISHDNLPSIITAAAVTIITVVIIYGWD